MDDNIKAFPLPLGERSVAAVLSPGMDLRDYFAAHIAQGMAANKAWLLSSNREIAQHAFAVADAMMVERGKTRWPNWPNGVTEVQMGGNR
jgi:hypothetical protein